ncbi:MAG: (2Fe-2S)-binding protein [Deferrisomatales bacterium]
MGDTTYVCRCEDVTLAEVEQALDDGARTLEEVKRLTRCTMGPCQGRTCRHVLAQVISRRTGVAPGELDVPTYRAPVKPVKLGVIADGERDA